MDTNESLLRAILATVARSTFSPADIYKIVVPVPGGDKQLTAYNLCDGKIPQAEIGKRAKLDKGSLSRSISRWIEAGIVVRVGRDQHPMHLYPITRSSLKSPAGEK